MWVRVWGEPWPVDLQVSWSFGLEGGGETMAAPLSLILLATWLVVSSSMDWAVTSLLGVWDPTQHSHSETCVIALT